MLRLCGFFQKLLNDRWNQAVEIFGEAGAQHKEVVGWEVEMRGSADGVGALDNAPIRSDAIDIWWRRKFHRIVAVPD